MMRPETKSVPPEMIKLIPVDLCISICVNFYFAYMGTCFFYISYIYTHIIFIYVFFERRGPLLDDLG